MLVTNLTRLGYSCAFEVPTGGHVLDAKCDVDEQTIFFEVVAPEQSDASVTQQKIVSGLGKEVSELVSGCRLEIELFPPILSANIPGILEQIRRLPSGIWIVLKGTARFRKIDFGEEMNPIFDGDGSQVIFPDITTTDNESSQIVIKWEASDIRAKRIFNEEYHQFSDIEANVLIVNISAVTDGMTTWPALMKNLMQPGRNRNVGAIAFFEQSLHGPPEDICRKWLVIENPHAHKPIPRRLLQDIQSLGI